jgi:transposase
MFYLGIDQHAKQLTVNLRNEEGTVVLRRQVSTRPEKVREFLAQLAEQTAADGGYAAVVEVCGFNDWLLQLLPRYGCRETLLVQADEPGKRKTDRRDANQLGERLWINRHRLAAGRRLQDLRRVEPPTAADAAARQLTALRRRLGADRIRVINRAGAIVRKHNLEHVRPTRGPATQRARRWMAELTLPAIDRLELDLALARLRLLDEQWAAVNAKIAELKATHPTAALVSTVPGLKGYGGLAIAARIGDVRRFPTPGSLANYWGLTPSCRNSGVATRRLGSITKQGSPLVRFLLGQAVLHVLRADASLRAWYVAVKARRGSKVARTAVMRRLAVIIWRMVKDERPYHCGPVRPKPAAAAAAP